MVLFYKIWKRYNEIQLTKNNMNLNIRKIKNHPPSQDCKIITLYGYFKCANFLTAYAADGKVDTVKKIFLCFNLVFSFFSLYVNPHQ